MPSLHFSAVSSTAIFEVLIQVITARMKVSKRESRKARTESNHKHGIVVLSQTIEDGRTDPLLKKKRQTDNKTISWVELFVK